MALNPYYDCDFFEFIVLFFSRLQQLISGQAILLASDEIQVLTLVCLGSSAAILGCFLLLKKQAMAANSISHTVLLGLVISLLVQRSIGFNLEDPFHLNFFWLMVAGVITGVVTVSLIHFLHHVLKVQLDASNGLVFNLLFSLGILLISLFFKNAHVGVELITEIGRAHV